MDYILVGIGGIIGSCLRYSLYLAQQSFAALSFPLGTLVINTAGCIASGYCLAYFESSGTLQSKSMLFITVGILGSFTTFSAFSLENFQMLRSGEITLAVTNVLLSVLLGLAGVWLGYKLHHVL